jgi:gas vesicle protein
MSETTSSRTASVVMAFAAGALAGAVAAFLLAPRSGRDTREMLGKAAKTTKDLATRVPAAVRGAREAFAEAVNGASTRSSADTGPIALDATN